jgi:hypothetical protein
MRRLRRTILVATAAIAIASPAAAQAPAPVDLLFSASHMRDVAIGEVVDYAHQRRSRPEIGVGPDIDGRIIVEKRADAASTVTLDAEGRVRVLEFDHLSGNPLLMVFLESVARTVSGAQDGNPAWARSAIKGALRDGLESEGDGATRVLTLRPFAQDDARALVGPFADLTLTFAMDESAPGMFDLLRAEAPAALYVEEIARDANP